VNAVAFVPSLVISAAHAWQFPAEDTREQSLEVAFLGRSNVGKSSLLNKLVGKRDLAFTSARPGCTQTINFFQIEEHLRFVDLPGYGYARVPIDQKDEWKKLIEEYLVGRRSLALSIILLDARRGWMEKDLELKNWLEFHNRRFQVVITKVDKWKSNNQLNAGMAGIRNQVPSHEPLPFSAVDGRGVREIWQVISKIKNK
jgi:GTP-binding protein